MTDNVTPIDSKYLAPASYEQMFTDHFDLIKGLVIRNGINLADVDDVAMDIFTKFMEKDFLAKYEGDKTFETSNGVKRTKFTTFLSGFVTTYVMQHRDRQMTRARKEPVHLETPVGEDGATWVDVYGPTDYTLTEDLDAKAVYDQYIAQAVAHLNTLEVRGIRNLPEIFLMIIDHVITDGKVDRKAIAAHYKVSDTAICLAFRDLRKALEDAGLGRAFLQGLEDVG